jgi:hypothetical protein
MGVSGPEVQYTTFPTENQIRLKWKVRFWAPRAGGVFSPAIGAWMRLFNPSSFVVSTYPFARYSGKGTVPIGKLLVPGIRKGVASPSVVRKTATKSDCGSMLAVAGIPPVIVIPVAEGKFPVETLSDDALEHVSVAEFIRATQY